MFRILFIIFFAIAVFSEYYVFRAIKECGTNWKRVRIYNIATISYWFISLAFIASALWFETMHPVFMQAAGIVIFIFMLNGFTKLLLSLFIFGGRIAKQLPQLLKAGLIFITALNCIVIITAFISTSSLRVEKEIITSPKIPASMNGLRIAVVSDMHTGLLLGRTQVSRNIVNKINSLNPDIVINCGDIVNHDFGELNPKIIGILSEIRSRYGIYSVLGNHDLGIYIRDTARLNPDFNIKELTRKQQYLGWNLLRDESAVITNGTDSITITGLDYPDELIHKSHEKLPHGIDFSNAYAGLNPDAFNITISHAPQTWNDIKSTGIADLTISGHVHSLQMKLKTGKGRGWSPAALIYDRWSGRYDENGKTLYINDGIGYAMIPIRMGVRPEITLIELKQEEK